MLAYAIMWPQNNERNQMDTETKPAIIGDDILSPAKVAENKAESEANGSQIMCENCKGMCEVILENGSKEACLVCKGTGIQQEENNE